MVADGAGEMAILRCIHVQSEHIGQWATQLHLSVVRRSAPSRI